MLATPTAHDLEISHFQARTAFRSMQILGLCEVTLLYQALVVAEVKVTVTRSPSARPTAEALKYGPR